MVGNDDEWRLLFAVLVRSANTEYVSNTSAEICN